MSDEDVVDEEAGDHITHTFTLPQPHIHTAHRDSVIYVERKGNLATLYYIALPLEVHVQYD